MYNNDLFQSTNDTSINGSNNFVNNDTEINYTNNNSANTGMTGGMQNSGCGQNGSERVVHRTFMHDVPQACFFMIEK